MILCKTSRDIDYNRKTIIHVAPQCPLQLCSHEHEFVITMVVKKTIVILLTSCKTQDVL